MSQMRTLLLFAFLFLNLSCSNIFQDAAVKDGDKVLLFEVQRKLDKSDWTGAITTISQLTSETQARRDVQLLLASAYAGRCGLDVLDIIQQFQNKPSSTTFFSLLMTAFQGAVSTNVSDCTSSEQILYGFSSRTADEDIMLALVEFSLLGATFASEADTDANGTVDAGYNPCTDVDDTLANTLVSTVARSLTALAASGDTISGSPTSSLNTVCEALESVDPDYNFCTKTDPTAVTAEERQALRILMSESSDGVGLGTCPHGTPNVQNCSPNCGI